VSAVLDSRVRGNEGDKGSLDEGNNQGAASDQCALGDGREFGYVSRRTVTAALHRASRSMSGRWSRAASSPTRLPVRMSGRWRSPSSVESFRWPDKTVVIRSFTIMISREGARRFAPHREAEQDNQASHREVVRVVADESTAQAKQLIDAITSLSATRAEIGGLLRYQVLLFGHAATLSTGLHGLRWPAAVNLTGAIRS
jgi:hypothetical protein